MTDPLTVLIIGASSDIARATARRYGRAGYSLILAARDVETLRVDLEDLRIRYDVTATAVMFDILDLPTHSAMLDALPQLPATIICVVGLLGDQRISSANQHEAKRVMDTNYVAPALFLDAAAARMAARGSGTIIGISSVAGDRGRASNYTYGSAKAGFTAFLSGLRNRLAASSVHVVTVKPGFVDTKMTVGMNLPKKLTAQPEEVADAIFSADQKRKNVIYVRPIWMIVMAIIRLIPEAIFKKLTL